MRSWLERGWVRKWARRRGARGASREWEAAFPPPRARPLGVRRLPLPAGAEVLSAAGPRRAGPPHVSGSRKPAPDGPPRRSPVPGRGRPPGRRERGPRPAEVGGAGWSPLGTGAPLQEQGLEQGVRTRLCEAVWLLISPRRLRTWCGCKCRGRRSSRRGPGGLFQKREQSGPGARLRGSFLSAPSTGALGPCLTGCHELPKVSLAFSGELPQPFSFPFSRIQGKFTLPRLLPVPGVPRVIFSLF